MSTSDARSLARWPALCALACALLAFAPCVDARAHARTRHTRQVAQSPRQSQPPQEDEEEAGSTVRGRVVYDDTSRPLRRARVALVGEGIGRSGHAGLTDARGEFQISGVPAGSYFIFADVPGVLSPAGFVNITELRGGAPNFAEARGFFEVIEVDGKQDVRVTVRARRGAVLSGKVSYADGDPAVNVTVNVMRRVAADDLTGGVGDLYVAGEAATSNATATGEQGRWEFKEIPDGNYTIVVRPAEEYERTTAETRAPDGSAASDGTTNTVAYGREMVDGGRISGTVTIEGRKPPSYAYIHVMRVSDGTPGAENVDLQNASSYDGSFNVEGLPAGKFSLQLDAYDEQGNLYVKSINWKGRNLLREPLALAEGEAAEGVEILLARNPATLRVSVTGANKKAVMGALVLLTPTDPSEWQPHVPPLYCPTADQGFCTVNVPPGEYRVVAMSRAGLYSLSEAEAEARRRADASPRVTLHAGETKEFAVVLSEK